MRVLVIGSGGREYELARQMSLSSGVTKVYVAPGNGGTAALDKTENVPEIGPTDKAAIVAFVQSHGIGLTILGPDAAVAAGVGDALIEVGAKVFGPTREAGRLESSKIFAAEFMTRHDIPQPPYKVARSLEVALGIVADRDPTSYVIKADGLADGKGVVLPETTKEAERVVQDMFGGEAYKGAGKEGVQIQERYHGPELSVFVVTDGTKFILLPFSQDHKRLQDGDQGPNTGGMGVIAPLPTTMIGPDVITEIKKIADKTIASMASDGRPYRGVLYIGMMLAEERGGNPVVIEYNARFGDPEAEALLALLNKEGFDVANMLERTAAGDISSIDVPQKFNKVAVTVALAAKGYPADPQKGDEIFGLDQEYKNVVAQHAGTKREGDKLLTAGGRVLYVTGVGRTPAEAHANAYRAIGPDGIHFEGMQYRTDIGYQLLVNP